MRRTLSPQKRSNQVVAELRAALPVGKYIEILHAAAVTGYLPVFTYDPTTKRMQPTGAHRELKSQEQLDLLRYLVDKILPSAPKEIDVSVSDDKPTKADVIKTLSSEDLKRIVDAEYTKDEPAPG